MKRILTLALLFLLSGTTGFSQGVNLNIKNQLFLRCTPTSLFDPFGARFPIGVEYGIGRQLSIGGEVSIPLLQKSELVRSIFNIYPREKTRITSDFYLRLDSRLYFKASDRARAFLGGEFFWRNQELQDVDGSYIEYSTLHQYTKAEVYKNMFGLGAVLGGNILVAQTILIEPYCGLGIRYFAVHRLNVENYRRGGTLILGPPEALTGGYENEVGGESGGLYFPLGVKVSVPLNN